MYFCLKCGKKHFFVGELGRNHKKYMSNRNVEVVNEKIKAHSIFKRYKAGIEPKPEELSILKKFYGTIV